MTTIKIITDSSCDLPEMIVDEIGIDIVPLSVHFGEECMPPDMKLADFYARMKKESVLPKTSSPAPQLFLAEYQKTQVDQDILVISLSSALSSTYHHAVMAKEMLLEEGFAGRIEIIDSKTTSLGLGVLVYKAAKMAEANVPFEKIVEVIKQAVKTSGTFFFLDTLENVIKGGRLDRVRGAVASVLNIKLLMKGSEEGTIEVIEKIRGTQQALKRLITKIGDTQHDFDKDVIAVAHCNCEDRAREVLNQLLDKYPFRKVLFSNMGTVIGTYAGEGGVLIAY
ncbi:DegV family protein [Paenibacillus alginolyticus]|uniref:DegV family protein n=1 Tax=Paenibacillus alginolyticus TaxID=59839 RepID=A0ABT4GL94_9BACL|nr:DegV family protein [Paenibacillus alginolyticus]MCY9696967.1 DegV family protein [Paenibacillus alginolyticus]MEC0147353.1 DegV family protein [Paenibacillus alginolyticus]